MKIKCPYCGRRQDVPTNYIDREVKCIKCHNSYMPIEQCQIIRNKSKYPEAIPTKVTPICQNTPNYTAQKRIRINIALVSLAILVLGVVAYNWHIKKVRAKSYVQGINDTVDFTKALQSFSNSTANTKSEYNQPNYNYNTIENMGTTKNYFQITETKSKIVESDETYVELSWYAKIQSANTCKATIRITFHDKTGFEVDSDILFDVYIKAGENTITHISTIKSNLYRNITNYRISVNKNLF